MVEIKTLSFYILSKFVFSSCHQQFKGQQEDGGGHCYSSLPLPCTQKHSENYFNYLQFCSQYVCTVLLIRVHLISKIIPNEIHLPFASMLVTLFLLTSYKLLLISHRQHWIWTSINYHPSFTYGKTSHVRQSNLVS